MDIQHLKIHLDEIVKISNSEWLASLNERKIKELEFHNLHRERTLIEKLDHDTYDKFYSNKKFYSTVRQSNEYCDQWISKNAKGKVFLDYACGDGGNAIKAAKGGAESIYWT